MTFSLSHQVVGSLDRRLAFVLHGVFGAGHNFRSFVRKLAERRPEYGFVLVDLRHHGSSQGAPPPDTLAACARDLQRLAERLGRSPTALIGHSFGGKVALARSREAPPELAQVWVLDSDPGAQRPDTSHQVLRVLAALERAPVPAASRTEVVEHLTGEGLSLGIANWLSSNLTRRGSGREVAYHWQFDLRRIEALLDDYFAQDLWHVLEHGTATLRYELVLAGQGDRWSSDMRERARTLARQGSVGLHVVPNSGHWLHVDNPEYLLDLLARELV